MADANAAPTVDFASIDSTTDSAGATQFAVKCAGAADSDEPLSFMFAYAFSDAPAVFLPLGTSC
jgi:hypothetical protein